MPMKNHARPLIARFWLGRLSANSAGVALIEFAFSLPILVTLSLTGAELTNFITVKMRVSQLALHVADHGARMGTGSPLADKTISETDINDLFVGANLQAGELGVLTNGRIILSSLEPIPNTNPSLPPNRYKINWQRCKGARTSASSYGREGDTNLMGIGPAGRQVQAPADGAVMFVEISYAYKPILPMFSAQYGAFSEIAAMPVRDSRKTTAPENTNGAPVSRCP